MPVNLPSLTELQNAQFVDPMFFGQVQNQIGLGNQFAQQGLEKGAADLQQQILANLFAEENNPQRVEEQRLRNEGLGYANQSSGVKARTDVALEGESREAKRAELLKSASEDDLKRLMAQAEAELLNPDPQVQARAQKKLDGSWGEIQRRNKAADTKANTELLVGGRKTVAEINADARRDSAQISADVRAAKGANATDFEALILKNARNPTAQAEIRISRAEQLANNGDAVGAARQLQLAAEARARAAEDTSNRGLATPGVDVASVANLPPADRPAARATVGTVRPTTDGAGNPVRVPAATQTQRDAAGLSTLQVEIRDAEASLAQAKRNNAPASAIKELEGIIAGLKREVGRVPAAAKAAAPKAPEGRVIIYKDGKPVGSVPQAQADAAVKQGYSLK